MRRILIGTLLSALAASALALAVSTSTKTVNISALSDDWTDFQFKWTDYNDQSIVFTISTNSSGSAYYITNNYCTFQVVGRVSGETNTIYLNKGISDCTIAANTVTITVAYSNVPPPGTYKGELLLKDTSGTTMRTLARGTILVRESLFAE